MASTDTDLERYRSAYAALIDSRKTLLLATRNGEQPEVSYAPFIRDADGFYIFISDLAQHSRNLQQCAKAGVMLIEDEESCQNLFARQRASFDCTVSQVAPQEVCYTRLLDRMEQQLGNVVGVLRNLADFKLFVLQPSRGRFVVGFGNAFDIDPLSGELTAIDADAVARLKGEC